MQILSWSRERDCAEILKRHEVTLRKTSAAKDDAPFSFYRASTVYWNSGLNKTIGKTMNFKNTIFSEK